MVQTVDYSMFHLDLIKHWKVYFNDKLDNKLKLLQVFTFESMVTDPEEQQGSPIPVVFHLE